MPDTLDLAERARWFLQGAARTQVPLVGYDLWVPGGPAVFTKEAAFAIHRTADHCPQIPCIGTSEGYPNWGKLALGIFLAHRMTSYDSADADGTLSAHYRTVTAMLDWDTRLKLADFAGKNGLGGQVHVTGSRYITPATVVMIALEAYYEYHPDPRLKETIDEYVRMHKDYLIPQQLDGKTYYNYLDIIKDRKKILEAMIGYQGAYDVFPFVDGRAASAMFTWYRLTGNEDALAVGAQLTDFLRNFRELWRTPDASRFPPEEGQFVGETHSYLQAALAFLFEAEVRRQRDPEDEIAKDDINRARAIYEFTKRRTHGAVLGNFGDMDTVDDMIRLGLKLTDLGAGNYYDEVERWTRNQLAEGQIDPLTGERYIANDTTGDYSTDHVGRKVIGMWYSDATHALAIPPRAWMYDIDGATNPMHALYEVWDHIVRYDGSAAQVNFALNCASKYIDVKSELPYRGRIEVGIKGKSTPLTSLRIRIPGWVDKKKVVVKARLGSDREATLKRDVDWEWGANQEYVTLRAVRADASYIVAFPVKVQQLQFEDVRGIDQFWHEGDYASVGTPENITKYTGVFRGSTLVEATPRPAGNLVPRYQREALARLKGDAPAPTMVMTRFVIDANPPLSAPADPVQRTPPGR